MNVYIVIPLICATIFSTLSVIALRHPTRERAIFILYLIAGTVWSFCSAMAYLGFFDQLTFTWVVLRLILGSSMVVVYYHLVRRFTNGRNDVLVYLGYIASLVIIFLAASGFIIQDAYVTNGSLFIDYADYAIDSLIIINSIFVNSINVSYIFFNIACLCPFFQ